MEKGYLKSPQISANASSFGFLVVVEAPDEPQTSCVSNRPPAVLEGVGAGAVDQGLLLAPKVGAVEGLGAAAERSSPPKEEVRLEVAAVEVGEVKDEKSPKVSLPAAVVVGVGVGLVANRDMMSFLPLEVVVGEVVVVVLEGEGSCQSRSKIPPPPPPAEAFLGGAAVVAGAGGCLVADAVAAGAGAGDASSSRSNAGAAFLTATLGVALAAAAPDEPLAVVAAGTSAPPSKTLGSLGGGPSFAHLLDSYLLLINDSIL